MTGVAIVVVIAIVVVVAVLIMRSNQSKTDAQATPAVASASGRQLPGPLVVDFHVAGDTASTVFEVPLGDAAAGDHLKDLLSAAAVEYVRAKADEGLPLGDLRKIDVSALRGETPELVVTVELPEVGTLPAARSLWETDDHDPIGAVAAVASDSSVSSEAAPRGSLEPVAQFVNLGAASEAKLRAIGVDTSDATLRDLVLGLMRVSGYQVSVGRPGFHADDAGEATVYDVTKAGSTSTVVLLAHEEGEYPEVDERVFTKLAVATGQIKTPQLLFVTDKYGPYAMYDLERRTDKLVLVTRERLQAFVDSFLLG